MKTLLFLSIALLSFTSVAQEPVKTKKAKVQVTIEFVHINEGYDHTTKDKIYVNDVLVYTTPERKESEVFSEKIKLPGGVQTVRIENWTLYEGNWEQTLRGNEYSIDGLYDEEIDLGKKSTLKVVYDLDDPSSPNVTLEKLK